MTAVVIRSARPADAQVIADIYNHYVRGSISTFETEPVEGPEMARRMAEIQRNHAYLVCTHGERIIGYAYAARWSHRHAYRYTAESTIYLDPRFAGRGIGQLLYADLIEETRTRGAHAIVAGISMPNPASIALHEKLGFEQVAHFRQTGFKFEKWIDVGYWELVMVRPDPHTREDR